jgi:rhodanese-related sulfurtransferase
MQARPNIISRADLHDMIDRQEDFTLVEVLPEESFRHFHLPGAVNLPGGELRERIAEVVPDRDEAIVVYCASPSCTASDRAAELLTDMGYTDVRDYRGGKQHWKEGRLPVTSAELATA